MPREHELRCFCRTQPLLATYGVDASGELFVHIKIYKQSRIFGEIIFKDGVAKIKCRNCLRWHKVIFRPKSVVLSPDESSEAQAPTG
jgi:hypothetical protein